MKTRSVLIYCPGYPLDPKALMPSRILATAAGCLLDAGHVTHIHDYGTVECVDRLLDGKLSEAARRVGDSLSSDPALNPLHTIHTLWRVRAADRLFRTRMEALCGEIARDLIHTKGLHFVGFLVNTIEDIDCAVRIAGHVRLTRPKLRIMAFGPLVEQYGLEILNRFPVFDCLCVGDFEMSLVALAEKVDTPQSWASIPNLAIVRGSQPYLTETREGPSLGAYPAPVYEPDTYPALRAGQKLKLFELEDSRGYGHFANAFPRRTPAATVRMKPVSLVCNEMWRIGTLFGARTFSICGPDAPASHLTALARELVRRRMRVIYSRSSTGRGLFSAIFPILRSSGCLAMSFLVDTGSQRLLDRFYGRDFTVTEIEATLRAAKRAGIYTIARFTYPCPEDDYHTRAETIRLLVRTRPHAAPVEFPEVLPHSQWHRKADTFGFRFHRDGQLDHALRCSRKFPLPSGAWRVLPYRVGGQSASQVLAAQQALVAEFTARGVEASMPDELARLARLAGYVQREREFGARVQQDFLTGDAAGIATLVDQYNEAACVPAKGVALQPFDSFRIAVGN